MASASALPCGVETEKQTIGAHETRSLFGCDLEIVHALELRRRLGGATYGEVLSLLREQELPLPRAPVAGREDHLSRARSWMFPKHVA